MSDDANAELGIAISNAKASKQKDWSIRYLNERVMAQLLIFCFVLFVTVWMIETPVLIRNSVTGVLIFLAVYWVIMSNRRKAILKQTREQQLEEHKQSKG